MINQIPLTARRVDSIHFVFIPKTWAKALKPYAKAKWTSEQIDPRLPKEKYTLQNGHFLLFPQFNMTKGGFFAAHLYAVVKELDCAQVHAELTVEGLTLVTIGGSVKSKITLKPRGWSIKDTPHHAILNY